MGLFSVGEATRLALGELHGRRRGGRHRRGSVEAGTFEEAFFTVPAKGETDHLLHVARRTLDAGRRLRRDARAGARILSASERTIAALTAAAVRVYEEILTLARLNRGRVFPSYDHLANATGLGRATVARALPVLEAIGFLVRQRRFNRVAGEDGRPRYAQTSNVYRALLPQRVLAYLPRWLRPAPLPCDEIQRRAEEAGAHRAMLATLSCRDLAQATVEGPLGRALALLGAGIDRRARESQNGPGSLNGIL
ncbi:MAG: helix-turn-helix domain-containing protein [Sphingomonas sp.]|nr:MAG: helix-turn-helix domain-containing protein [Sphingomonas sp.]